MQHLKKETLSIINRYITEYIDKNGISPTLDDISTGTGIPKTTVQRYVAYMREQKMVEMNGKRSIVTNEIKVARQQTIRVPILGAVSCGIPKLAEENIEDYVRLPITLFGQGNFFLLRANGDSMVNAGIDNGDIVLIRQQPAADPGQIVVALMDEEATLKRFYPEPENNRVKLHPENEKLDDIYVENCVIQGVAVKVLKDLI